MGCFPELQANDWVTDLVETVQYVAVDGVMPLMVHMGPMLVLLVMFILPTLLTGPTTQQPPGAQPPSHRSTPHKRNWRQGAATTEPDAGKSSTGAYVCYQ